jgi:MOSC domain-containing protein
MWVSELWRYPVKSMAGEPMHTVLLGQDGIDGDRLLHVRDRHGRVVTSRSRPGLLGLHAVLGADGEPLVDDRPWTDPWVSRAVAAAAGDGARLVRSGGVERFDILPLLVATDGAIAAFGHDRRRLRPNVVIGGVAGLEEREWEGRALRAGATVIGIRDLRQRCIMTTFDPDTLEQDVEVLKGIHRKFGGSLALNAYVVRGGTLSVGDPVELVAE